MNPMSEQEFRDLLRQSYWSLRSRIEEVEKEFHLGTFPRYDWDQWRGELVFSSGGVPKIVARIQIVGSLSSKSNTWLWAWSNPGFLEPLKESALRAREFGAERGLERLVQSRWPAKETDAWEMTGLAFELSKAKSAFRSPAPEGFTFLLFMDLRAVSNRRRVFGARTCSHVLSENRAILLVSRESDGEVLAVCGAEDDTAATIRDIPLSRLLQLDPTLSVLADMPDGWVALRDSPADAWVRSQAQ